ncbi:hypothetical protein ACQ7CX_10400 [Chryseobacterium arthrosphaerae]|uniref:Uncharacterized protein n=1 Tax=Soonwooa buanensis TaxID=619805 RepID=A0A1T5CN05_9FLAO|nr:MULTISPECIES: hypothetical protein [Chryseobacterium group]QUY53852.1 hypothetical protein I2F65_13250 [Chryseobacterium arthrosphaerae]SKB60888.1 hypothetical protein SAMN05660477_00198 [Soonwooa buanensis]
MEIFEKEFVQVTVPPFEKQNSQNAIKATKLLDLIIDDGFRERIIKHYGLESLDFYISIGNVDLAFQYVNFITKKYEYINLWSSNNNVVTKVESTEENTEKTDLYFDFAFLNDDDGVIISGLKAKSIYDSSSMFYNDRELSKYINFLKSKNTKVLAKLSDRNKLIADVNDSWKLQYERNPSSIQQRKFRFLKDKKERYYLRSITSERYEEYGVAFSFVISILSLHKIMQSDKGLNLKINSLSINESKIDMVVSTGNPVYVEEIDRFISSSILIKNNDLGDRSLSFTHTLKLNPKQDEERKIYLFPKLKEQEINYKMSISHTAGIEKVLSTFDNLGSVIYSMDEYIKDFKGIANTNTPDELRAKIEEKIISNNSPFKEVKELKSLFTRSTSQHIDNLAKLLEVCQKAEMINMDYDIKFKLRYLISNVLLYGKNSY